jgi:FkbM family methyltransferase
MASPLRTFIGTTSKIFSSYPLSGALRLYGNYLRLLINNRLRPERNSEKIAGFKVLFPHRDLFFGLVSDIFFHRTYPTATTEQKTLIVDCGSNIGITVLYFKWLCPHATIVCFEPNPEALQYLRRNIEVNELSGVKVFPFALGKSAGSARLALGRAHKAGPGASLYLSDNTPGRRSRQVEIRKLSEFITKPVDVLKLDVEGAEGDIIEDLAESDKLALIKEIHAEYHFDGRTMNYPLEKILALLEQAGFKCQISRPLSSDKPAGEQKKSLRTAMVHASRA